jgi:hypothetical protein
MDEELNADITAAMESITKETLARVVENVSQHLQMVLDAHTEYVFT